MHTPLLSIVVGVSSSNGQHRGSDGGDIGGDVWVDQIRCWAGQHVTSDSSGSYLGAGIIQAWAKSASISVECSICSTATKG